MINPPLEWGLCLIFISTCGWVSFGPLTSPRHLPSVQSWQQQFLQTKLPQKTRHHGNMHAIEDKMLKQFRQSRNTKTPCRRAVFTLYRIKAQKASMERRLHSRKDQTQTSHLAHHRWQNAQETRQEGNVSTLADTMFWGELSCSRITQNAPRVRHKFLHCERQRAGESRC